MDSQVAHGDHDVRREQHDRDRQREEKQRVALVGAVAAPRERRRDRQESDGAEHGKELHAQRSRVDLPVAARNHRRAEHEQDVRDDRAGQGPTHDAGEIVRDSEQRDDQLRRIAEARVQEAADAGACVLCRMLRRLADHPGEGDQRERRDDEERGLVEVEDEAAEDRDGSQGKQCPEDLSRHAASLATR